MQTYLKKLLILSASLLLFRCGQTQDSILITYPLNNALFPPEIAPPEIRWTDSASQWKLVFTFNDGSEPVEFIADTLHWTPDSTVWVYIKAHSLEKPATLTISRRVRRFGRDLKTGSGSVTFSTSGDSVGAPIFFRELPIPISYVARHINGIQWLLGDVASSKPPQIVLENMTSCANCHSFSADGQTVGMDVDYRGDKSGYSITSFDEKSELNEDSMVYWNHFFNNNEDRTTGILSRLSPDGRYALTTVQERIFYLNQYDKAYSFLFFPVTGILAFLDRTTDAMVPLAGADDPEFVQTNGVWSPDGETIVFARADAFQSKTQKPYGAPIDHDEATAILGGEKFLISGQTGAKRFMYDLYSLPFNQGAGGIPVPVPGASRNNKSNYFPKISPDGRWLVYTQARSYMLANKGSELFITSMQGGRPKRMRCNAGEMNSWHSWSPNSRWLVYASKVFSEYTELWLTHIDDTGDDSVPVWLQHFVADKRAANIPEFVNISPEAVRKITPAFPVR